MIPIKDKYSNSSIKPVAWEYKGVHIFPKGINLKEYNHMTRVWTCLL